MSSKRQHQLSLAALACLLLVLPGCSLDDNNVACPGVVAGSPISAPAWSPPGDLILFNLVPLIRTDHYDPQCNVGEQVFDLASSGVYGYSLGDHKTRRLLAYTVGEPSFSSAGDRMAFEQFGDIYTIGFTGSDFDTLDIRRLTYNGANYGPTWSPNGNTIAYVHVGCNGATEGMDSTSCGVQVMNVDGGSKRRVAYGTHPSWFPDSQHLAYVGLWDNVFVMGLTDSVNAPVTKLKSNSGITHYGVFVSPDGSTIALTRQSRNAPVELWTMAPDGTGFRRITSDSVLAPVCWSPDSREIVYVRHRSDDWTDQTGTLWTVNLATGKKRLINSGKVP